MLQKKNHADGREIKLLGLLHLPVVVAGSITVQQIYVTLTLFRSMILGRDWLQSKVNPDWCLKTQSKYYNQKKKKSSEVIINRSKCIISKLYLKELKYLQDMNIQAIDWELDLLWV